MDIILLAGVVLDTTDIRIEDKTDYRIAGFCLYNHTKQSYEFVDKGGIVHYLNYIEEHGYYAIGSRDGISYSFFYDGVADYIKSSMFYANNVVKNIAVFNRNFNLISSHRYVILGAILISYFSVGIVFDCHDMAGYDYLEINDCLYYEHVKLLKTDIKDPVFYLNLLLGDFRWTTLDMSNNYYRMGDAGLVLINDLTTFIVPRELKVLGICFDEGTTKDNFSLILWDSLEYLYLRSVYDQFDISSLHSFLFTKLRIYITKNCRCYSLYEIIYKFVEAVAEKSLGRFSFGTDIIKGVVRTKKLKRLEKYMDIVQYFARHSGLLMEMSVRVSGYLNKYVDIILLED